MIDFDNPHRMLKLSHGELAYWVVGDGPDVVFVHGWPLHSATWRDVVQTMSASYRCHLIDLPGAGQTRWDDGAPFGLWEHARTLREALEKIGLTEFALVAHDSGATIARLLMTLMQGVWALVMGNTEVPGHPLPGLKAAKVAVALPGSAWLVQAATKSSRLRHKMFEGCFEDLTFIHGEFGRHFVEPLTSNPECVRGQLRLVRHIDWGVVAHELHDVHQQITAPVLLVWGERDPWFPWKFARDMIDSFSGPAAEVHLIPRAKLFAHEEFADEFAQATMSFLSAREP